MRVAGLPTVAIRRPFHPSHHPAQIRRSLSLNDSVHRSRGRANQWTACPFCPCMRQSIEEVSHTKRFHARLGSLPPPEFAEACSLANPPLTVVWSEEFTPNLPARGEHSGHPCNG